MSWREKGPARQIVSHLPSMSNGRMHWGETHVIGCALTTVCMLREADVCIYERQITFKCLYITRGLEASRRQAAEVKWHPLLP